MQLAKHINNSRTKHREQRESQRGFSLIEVLASTVLLLLLLGAVVFNVPALGSPAALVPKPRELAIECAWTSCRRKCPAKDPCTGTAF